MLLAFAASLSLLLGVKGVKNTQPNLQAHSNYSPLHARQLPAPPTGVKTIMTPQNVTIRYKEPGEEGVCETTPGVKSYSGYIDLSPTSHTFFYFFQARHNHETASITLWLNGGPGSDSLIGLFQELGPCNVTEDLISQVNPYSWSEVSNLLFLSQPLGVGFSYANEEVGSINPFNGVIEDASFAEPQGRFPAINATDLDTTELCAIATWHILQGFLEALPRLDSSITSKDFHLWTESYGGHYAPTFYNYFLEKNQLIEDGSIEGIQLNFKTLGIGNGLIDEAIQAPYYPEFAVNNSYGIIAYNETVYNYAKFALNRINGCLERIGSCAYSNRSDVVDLAICTSAANMCRDNVEGLYRAYSDRGIYDIRHPRNDPTPPNYFIDYLNLASTQAALGVDLNYTLRNLEVFYAFQQTGDWVYPNFKEDLEMVLDKGIRVSLYYGDADYICNWPGGEAVSLALEYAHSEEFRAEEYVPFVVNGTEYGEARQYGNFSFLRIYESGHEVPYYQPEASLELFRRVILGIDIAKGD